MRKITEESCSAFVHKRAYKKGNVEVTAWRYLLHGHSIAYIQDGELFITTCGWNTPTTLDRLRGLLYFFKDSNYPQDLTKKKGQLYLGGKPWDGSPVAVCALWK
jgi:hypothetical protein